MNTVQGQLQLFDVYGVWYNPWWHSVWFYGLIIFIVSMIFAYFIWRYLRTEKKLTPEQEALQALFRLSSLNYAQEKTVHAAYFQLTMIIKSYLIAQYGLKLQDKNDIEIAQELNGIIPENMISLLKEFFDRSFHIKFAYDVVCQSMLKQDIDMLHNLILAISKQQADPLGKS
jgi:hypothetical protein